MKIKDKVGLIIRIFHYLLLFGAIIYLFFSKDSLYPTVLLLSWFIGLLLVVNFFKISNKYYALFLVGIYFEIMGEYFAGNLYQVFTQYDKVLHFVNSAIIALFIYDIFKKRGMIKNKYFF